MTGGSSICRPGSWLSGIRCIGAQCVRRWSPRARQVGRTLAGRGQALDPYVMVIDSYLLGDRGVPRKQRHTARRVWQRLVAVHGARGGGDGVALRRAALGRAGPDRSAWYRVGSAMTISSRQWSGCRAVKGEEQTLEAVGSVAEGRVSRPYGLQIEGAPRLTPSYPLCARDSVATMIPWRSQRLP